MINLWQLIEWLLYLVVALAAFYLVCHFALWLWGLLKELGNLQVENNSETDSDKEKSL